jgi:glycosyltransferase involved in cell wall biosynthesis
MRVIICATEYYPDGSGIANVAYNVVRELKSMGVECTVCSPTGPDIKLGSLDYIKKYGILGMLQYWYKVSRYFKSNDYDIAWLHNPLFLGQNPFNKYLVTMHVTLNGVSNRKIGNSLILQHYKRISSKIESYSLSRFDPLTRFSCVSQTVCNELKTIGIPENRITCIPNGVEIARFQPANDKSARRCKFGLLRDDTVLLSVGRLTHLKQPHIIIEVFSHLEKELGDVTLCIAGSGELFENTKNLAEKKGLRKVLFLGHVDHDRDLPDLYACADYYIMTSKYEGLPLTLLEAMASGLPCIVSDIPNLRIVKEAGCGIIVDFTNLSEASNDILDYLNSNNHSHGVNARNSAINSFDWKIISESYLRILKNVYEH